jgi:predicted transcriptional regulator
MKRLSRMERRASEFDTSNLPPSFEILPWQFFNSDFKSHDRAYSEVEKIADLYPDQRIDLRPYMIQSPFMCMTTDKLQKVLDIFRYMQLRQICVINPIDGSLQGVISREDLFAFMSL